MYAVPPGAGQQTYPAAAGPGYSGAAVPSLGATPFLQVEGMVTPDVLADDQEYLDVRFLPLLCLCLPFMSSPPFRVVVG